MAISSPPYSPPQNWKMLNKIYPYCLGFHYRKQNFDVWQAAQTEPFLVVSCLTNIVPSRYTRSTDSKP